MSQVDQYTIPGSPLTMIGLATRLESIFGAIGSSNRGELSPDNAFEGMLWWDTSTTPVEVLKRFTVAAGWVELVFVNISTGVVSFTGLGTAALEDVGTTIGDVVQLEDIGGGVAGLPAVDGSQLTGVASSDSGTPIGGYVTVQTDLTGAEEPDPDTHIKLEAGLTGAGEYNEGKLGSESVTGSAPLVVATAQITDAESPLNGQTVHLLETERRFLRAGNAGTVENDQMQRITGSVNSLNPPFREATYSGVFLEGQTGNRFDGSGPGGSTFDFDSSGSPDARTSATTDGETRAKNIGVSAYMRIK